jgi:N-acetylmuramoyl-L-alanine amidase
VRNLGIACAGALLVALVVVGASSDVTVPVTAVSAMPVTAVSGIPVPSSESDVDVSAAEDAPEDVPQVQAARTQEASPEPPSRRRYRRRNYNRYPGPIPTPEEWVPPEGPVRIALQAGHWRANEAPDELRGLRDNGTAARGKPEWEVNLDIARRTAAMLEPMGYLVDVLPAVVPPDYRAHLFISIHADGSNDADASGFRVGSPRRDATGRASAAADLLQRSYREATGLRQLPDVTRRMSNYYAFNYRRYEHALHPMTIALILETGFLTSASDWRVIVEDPDRAARGIVSAVTSFAITPPPAGASVLAADLD